MEPTEDAVTGIPSFPSLSLDTPYTNSNYVFLGLNSVLRNLEKYTGSIPKSELYSLLSSSVVISREGKTSDRSFEELSITEKIRYHAKQEVGKPRKDMNLAYIRKYADEYLEGLEGKRIMLHGHKEYGKRKEKVVFLPYNSLLHSRYHKRLWRKFKAIDNHKGVGITLTLRVNEYRSVYTDIVRIKRYWDRLRSALHKKFPYWDGNFFYVMEIGENNLMVHLHVILYGIMRVEHSWLSREWHKITGDSYIVYCSAPHHPKTAKGYVSKYLSKAMHGELTDGVRLTWASGRRLWGCSRGLFGWLGDDLPVSEGWTWDIYLVSGVSYVGCYEVVDDGG